MENDIAVMAMKEKSLFQCLIVHTSGDKLVPMPITRADEAFMSSQYSRLVSLGNLEIISPDEDGEDDEDDYQQFCDLWSPTAFKGMAGDALGLDSNSISLTGFGQIQTHLNPHLLILYKTSQMPTSDPRTQAV